MEVQKALAAVSQINSELGPAHTHPLLHLLQAGTKRTNWNEDQHALLPRRKVTVLVQMGSELR